LPFGDVGPEGADLARRKGKDRSRRNHNPSKKIESRLRQRESQTVPVELTEPAVSLETKDRQQVYGDGN